MSENNIFDNLGIDQMPDKDICNAETEGDDKNEQQNNENKFNNDENILGIEDSQINDIKFKVVNTNSQNDEFSQNSDNLCQRNYDLNPNNDDVIQNINDLSQNNDDLSQNSDNLNQSKDDINQIVDDNSQIIDNLCQNNEDLSQDNDNLSQDNDDLNQNNDDISQNSDDLSQNNNDFNQNNDDIIQNIEHLSQNNDDLSQNNDDLNQHNHHIGQNIDDVIQNINDLSQNNDDASQNSDNLNQNNDDINQNNDDNIQNIEHLSQSNNDLSQNNDDMNQNNDHFSQSNDQIDQNNLKDNQFDHDSNTQISNNKKDLMEVIEYSEEPDEEEYHDVEYIDESLMASDDSYDTYELVEEVTSDKGCESNEEITITNAKPKKDLILNTESNVETEHTLVLNLEDSNLEFIKTQQSVHPIVENQELTSSNLENSESHLLEMSKSSQSWPCLEISPGGIIKEGRPEDLKEFLKLTPPTAKRSRRSRITKRAVGYMVYSCAKCQANFQEMSQLTRHLRHFHGSSNMEPEDGGVVVQKLKYPGPMQVPKKVKQRKYVAGKKLSSHKRDNVTYNKRQNILTFNKKNNIVTYSKSENVVKYAISKNV